jgi:ribosomal protein L15
MIDTVKLEIPRGLYLVDDKDSSKWSLVKRRGSFSVLARHFPKDGMYRPRLSIIKRGEAETLKIEFSIPKLLYNNNLQEVSEADFEAIIDKLKGVIESEYGIKIFRDNLKRAKVISFDPSKNILFTNSYTAKYIIKILSQVNFSLKLDKNKSDFRNDGESFQIYSQAHSFVIYDKIRDFCKTKNRAVDKDQTSIQRSLFDSVKIRDSIQEVVRLEIRLSQKRKVNETMERLGYSKNPLFQDLFQNNICQKIVIWYWENFIMKGNEIFFISKDKPRDILLQMISNVGVKPKEALMLVGVILLMKEEGGTRDLRSLIEPYYSKRSWYRLMDRLKEVSDMMEGSLYPPWIKEIEKQLKEFIPLDIEENEKGLQIYNKN